MLKRIGKKTFILLILFSVPFFMYAAEPQVSISVDRHEVVLGDSINMRITVRNVKNPVQPEIPKVLGVKIVYRGAAKESFSSVSIVVQGGRIKKETTGGGYYFDYMLTPLKKGIYKVPPFNIKEGGKIFTAKEFTIKALGAAEKSNDIFIKVSIPRRSVYVGEKFPVVFKWYFNKKISNYTINIPWVDGIDGFVISDPPADGKIPANQAIVINGGKQVPALKTTEEYKGGQYAVITLQKVLTAMSPGIYTLEPSFLKCDVVTGYEKQRNSMFDDFFDSDFNSFFGMGRRAITKPFSTRSNPVKIIVSRVPESKPQGYIGAVGAFKFNMSVSPVKVKAGEPVNIDMKIKGYGNTGGIEVPVLKDVPGMKGYEPEVKSSEKLKNGRIYGEKDFKKVLIPRSKGDYTIPAVDFVYFNPVDKQFRRLTRGPFKIHADKGEAGGGIAGGTYADGALGQKNVELIKKDIRYIKESAGKFYKPGGKIYKNAVYWAGFYIFPLFIPLALFFIRREKERLSADSGILRRRNAMKKAAAELKRAETAFKRGNARDFYSCLSKSVKGYIADKMNVSSALTGAAELKKLKAKGLAENDYKILRGLFEKFDEALFSGASSNVQKMKKDMETAAYILKKAEKVLR